MGWNLACYLFSAVLHRILPGVEIEGTELANGGRLKYKFNGEWSARLRDCPLE
jgi:delta14-sterol reductase